MSRNWVGLLRRRCSQEQPNSQPSLLLTDPSPSEVQEANPTELLSALATKLSRARSQLKPGSARACFVSAASPTLWPVIEQSQKDQLFHSYCYNPEKHQTATQPHRFRHSVAGAGAASGSPSSIFSSRALPLRRSSSEGPSAVAEYPSPADHEEYGKRVSRQITA